MRIAEESRWGSISIRSDCGRTDKGRFNFAICRCARWLRQRLRLFRREGGTRRRGGANWITIPGTWVNLDVSDLDAFAETGEVTLPVNVMGWAFTEVEIVYTAGFDPFPDKVKVACAQLVKNAQATPALNVKKNVAPDGMQFWYFADSLVDDMVRELLAPFVAQKVG